MTAMPDVRRQPPQVVDHLQAAFRDRPREARIEIEALLEVHVDDVVAADRSAERPRATPDVDAFEARHFARLRQQVSGDVLEVFQLAGELLELFWHVGRDHEESDDPNGGSADRRSQSMTHRPHRTVQPARNAEFTPAFSA